MNTGNRSVGPTGPANQASSPAALAAQFDAVRRHCAVGQFGQAEGVLRNILKASAGQPEAMLMLGEVLSAQGRYQDAISILSALLQRWPNVAPVQFCLGSALHGAGRYPEAAKHLRRAIELQPDFAAAHNNLGRALAELGDRPGAVQAYERALALEPTMVQARTNLGIVLLDAGEHDAAIFHLRQGVALKSAVATTHLTLALALERISNFPEALPHYEKAVALDPNLASGWVGLGSALRALGRFAEATAAFEKALAINPDLGAARYALMTLRREHDDVAELARLRRIMANPEGSFYDRGAAGMAAAKMLDDSGHFDEAFAAAMDGNRLTRAGQLAAEIRYDHNWFCGQNDAAMRIFTPEFFAATRNWGNPSELPVFIVGHQRTGTTLVEQICASHSKVYGAGELRDIGQTAAQIQRTAPGHWSETLFRPLADRHVQRLAALAPGKLRVTDKALDILFMLGLIPPLFPNARIIFTHRDGRDTALSLFMQHMDQQVAFATDLLDAGRRWREAERMAAYWARCLPLSMHHVQYETLISDFETEARKLIGFLGLEWEPACLEFHKTERAVLTASAWQVRQPIYDSSVGRWRNYAKHLAPLCGVVGIDPEAPTGARPADIA